jgi:5'(3')-deoxyribonucleotidase
MRQFALIEGIACENIRVLSIIAADILVDDNARHFERFLGQGLLFSAPHNLSEARYPRLNDWNDICRRFL